MHTDLSCDLNFLRMGAAGEYAKPRNRKYSYIYIKEAGQSGIVASNLRRGALDRAALAEKRLTSVLRTYSVATMRTLENKISDAGPMDMRIDPHVLTPVRNQMIASGVMQRAVRQNAPWYHLTGIDQATIDARLQLLVPMHRDFQRLGMRIGQALEIAVFKALRMQKQMMFLGHFKDLTAHDDTTLYQKEEPPQAVSANAMPGDRSLDFLASTPAAGLAGIEVKNIREWIYPDREEVTEMLLKCCSIDAVPVLIARRIHFSTFHVLSRCGVVFHQTYNQLLPVTVSALADQVRHKDAFGFHDIRVGNDPDVRLQKFIGENLPKVLPDARQTFDHYKDLLMSYGSREIDYTEFAARSRRRSEGKNEDFDEP